MNLIPLNGNESCVYVCLDGCEPNQNEWNVLFLMQSQKVVYKLNTK